MLDTQELARLFNEDEAVWCAFEKKRPAATAPFPPALVQSKF